MTPSQHIKLLKDCKDALIKEGFNLAILTLDRFDIPSLHKSETNSDMPADAYLIARLGKADEEKLMQLAEHLGLLNISPAPVLGRKDLEGVLLKIGILKTLMIDVATGGERIQNLNENYKELRSSIADALLELGVADPNSFGDLWSWYNKWKDGSLPTYASRRAYIAELYKPTLDHLQARIRGNVPVAVVVPETKAESPTTAPIELFEEDNPKPSFEVIQRRSLRDFLQEKFNLSELDSLAFDIDINPEDFRHRTISEFVVDFIRYCQRRGRLSQLEERAQFLRPTDWLSTSESRAHDIRIFTEGEKIAGESHWKGWETKIDFADSFPTSLKNIVAFANFEQNQFRDPEVLDKFSKYITEADKLASHYVDVNVNTDETAKSKEGKGLLKSMLDGLSAGLEAVTSLGVTKYAYREYRQTVKAKLGV